MELCVMEIFQMDTLMDMQMVYVKRFSEKCIPKFFFKILKIELWYIYILSYKIKVNRNWKIDNDKPNLFDQNF